MNEKLTRPGFQRMYDFGKTATFLFFTLVFLLDFSALHAQGFTGGFKAGLNYGTIRLGNVETNADGIVLESVRGNTGFFIGAIVSYGITDRIGVTADILYNQKGGRYLFEGEGYAIFTSAETENRYLFRGQKRENLNITHSFIDIPVQFYADLFSRKNVRLTAGFGPGFMVTSGAEGELTFSSPDVNLSSTDPNPDNQLAIRLSYNYYRDAAGEVKSPFHRNLFGVGIGNIPQAYPEAVGAYYMYEEKPKNPFYTMDLILTAGVAYRLSGNLWLGLRGFYSLKDVTRDSADHSRGQFNAVTPVDEGFVPRNSDDRYMQGQLWLGFSF